MLAGLVMGAAGNLERKAVIETGEHQAKGFGGAACELTGALVGQVAQSIDGFVDEFEGLGAQLFGVVECVGNRANETPASRATSLILTFAIAAPLMRFKYKPDCSIARL